MKNLVTLLLVFGVFTIAHAWDERLEAYYTFEGENGNVVKDRSGKKPALDLTIQGSVRRVEGGVRLTGDSSIRSRGVPERLLDALRKSHEITVVAVIHPENKDQNGPARIVSFSRNTSERNFTLGQERSQYDFRLRTTRRSSNGLPSTNSGNNKVKTAVTFVVFTRERSGKARLYVDGVKVKETKIDGDFSKWDNRHQLVIGNEVTNDRPWRGVIHEVAILSRSLSPREIEKYHQSWKSGGGPKPQSGEERNGLLFSKHVAPLFANQCMECHDSATRKGDLDLSTFKTAFANHDAAEIWESVESDDMPHKRPPLSPREKQHLKQWIDGGMNWSVAKIDPANYVYHGSARQMWVRRLTVDEYIETVKATVGVDISGMARASLPRDLRADGFSNTAYNLTVDFKHVEAYAKLASEIVRQVNLPEFARQFSKKRNVNDKDMRSLINAMGEWVLRGPIDGAELDIYRGITTTVVGSGGGFDDAVGYMLEAMLQSPRFIYRIEQGSGYAGNVSGHELASRLSYMIWGASPDRHLYQKAKSGDLSNGEVLAGEIDRMLSDPRAMKRSLQFASEWLNLGRLANLRPNRKHFPNWNAELASDMREETLAFYREVVWEKQKPMTSLLNEPVAYLTPALAKHYGIRFEGNGDERVRHDLSGNPHRGGLLTQGSVLTIGGDEASMVTRGLFVLNDVLRSVVKDPPPCVDTTPVATKAGLTQRAIAEDRIANKSCGGCHSKFEPLAFGLEKFDGLGMFHEKDHHGNRLREDGEILFPGEADAQPYQSVQELMNLLADSERVYETIAWKVTQFAIGRPLHSGDLPVMDEIIKDSRKQGGSYHSLIKAISLSDLVQKRQAETD